MTGSFAATLRKHWNVEFDDAGNIGRRYRRQDEIGTPFGITVDFETLGEKDANLRARKGGLDATRERPLQPAHRPRLQNAEQLPVELAVRRRVHDEGQPRRDHLGWRQDADADRRRQSLCRATHPAGTP